MKTIPLIPVTPGTLNGQTAQLVDARLLHDFLGVGRDFTTWIKERIAEFSFTDGEDFITVSIPPIRGAGNRGKRVDYFLTLDMAKELAMVERTSKGRQARRYFIDCERQLHRLQQVQSPPASRARPVALSRAERQAINRQAWAEVSGQAYAAFHQRREELLQDRALQPAVVYLPYGFVPEWAK